MLFQRQRWNAWKLFFVPAMGILLAGCAETSRTGSCVALTGTPWTPSAPNVSASYHDSSTTISKTVVTASGPVTGLSQAAPAANEISVPIDMTEDLGAYGSLTLVASTVNYPSDLQGSAYPLLVSLNDGTNEYINLARTGSGGDCWASGYYTCSSSGSTTNCSANSNCSISWPSAYTDRTHWEQHQVNGSSAVNSPSVNTFPTCNWSGGSSSSITDPACAFTTGGFFSGSPARLRYGVTYTAKYILAADSYPTVSGHTATLQVTVVKKTDNNFGGAVDLNVILVGNDNINASRTDKGKENLNTLISNVATIYSQSNSNVSIGNVNSIEWPCNAGSESYADLDVNNLGDMFAQSGTLGSTSSSGKAINIFLVNSINISGSGSGNFTVLGYDGAIGAPPLNGTASSGLTVATFDSIGTFNPSCALDAGICPVTSQESAFYQTSVVIAHEMGHYLGLNHPSEYTGTEHDIIPDTPLCTATQNIGGTAVLTIDSCINIDTNVYPGTGQTCGQVCTSYNKSAGQFCPSAEECQFNEVMWWTTKNFQEGTGNGDGNTFTSNGGTLINYSSLVQ